MKLRLVDTIFFESYSLWRLFLLIPCVMRSWEVVFSYPASRPAEDTLDKRVLRAVVQLLNPKARIRQVGINEISPQIYSANRTGPEMAEAMSSAIRRAGARELLHRLTGDDNVDRFYKMWLTRRLPYSIIYADLAARYVAPDSRNNVLLVPDGDDPLFSHFPERERGILKGNLPGVLRAANFLQFGSQMLLWRLCCLLLPVWMFLRHSWNGGAPSRKPVYELAVPVLWGVYRDEGRRPDHTGVLRFMDDTLIYDGNFRIGEVVHIFGDWKFPSEATRAYREAMEAKGIPYAERRKFGVNLRLFLLTLKAAWAALLGLFSLEGPTWLSAQMSKANLKGMYHYLLKRYEMENVAYKAELIRNEYNDGHVLGTIAANQEGRVRAAITHSATIYDDPPKAFVYVNRLAVACELYTRTFAPFWKPLCLDRIGKESIDSIVAERRNRDRIRQELEAIHGKRKWIVLVLFPAHAERCLKEQWHKIYEAFDEFRRIELDCHVFFRFRELTAARQYEYMSRFISLAGVEPRIHLEHERYTTHQLMAASDLVIAGNASFAINEALVAGLPVFTFGYIGTEKLYFDGYGRDFILREKEDVLRVLQGLERNFEGFDCSWDRLRQDVDYHHDGNNRVRLGEVLRQAAAQASPGV